MKIDHLGARTFEDLVFLWEEIYSNLMRYFVKLQYSPRQKKLGIDFVFFLSQQWQQWQQGQQSQQEQPQLKYTRKKYTKGL